MHVTLSCFRLRGNEPAAVHFLDGLAYISDMSMHVMSGYVGAIYFMELHIKYIYAAATYVMHERLDR